MTDEQMNKAIAEACGWKEVRVNGNAGIYKGFDNGAELRPDISDYCTDLNAMHEAEKKLDDQQYHLFSDHLYDTECAMQKQTQKWRWLSATARQRAEAFLRTLGKWEEVQG